MSSNSNSPSSVEHSLTDRFLDFWLLGGISIVLFIIMLVGSLFRESSPLIQQKFMILFPVFTLLSLFCNDPHFIISYKFGYGRGSRFIFRYWFSLIFVPLFLIALYTISYFFFNDYISQSRSVLAINHFFEFLGMTYRFGTSSTLGPELLSLSILIMYITVGWHYSKQVYGCMMVYNKYDDYRLVRIERNAVKYSLLFLAFYQFMYSSQLMDQSAAQGYQDPRFAGIKMLPLGLPDWLLLISKILAIGSFLLVVAIMLKKFLKEKRKPSAIFLVAWMSIYVWWIQVYNLPEYYFIAVPFLHSLQYLPFAYKMEKKSIPVNRWYFTQVSLRILVLILIGFLAFELIPSMMDSHLNTDSNQTTAFFITAFVIFINIHHFFIDSVVWRLDQKQVRSGLLDSSQQIAH
jgi:hypothetical protein